MNIIDTEEKLNDFLDEISDQENKGHFNTEYAYYGSLFFKDIVVIPEELISINHFCDYDYIIFYNCIIQPKSAMNLPHTVCIENNEDIPIESVNLGVDKEIKFINCHIARCCLSIFGSFQTKKSFGILLKNTYVDTSLTVINNINNVIIDNCDIHNLSIKINTMDLAGLTIPVLIQNSRIDSVVMSGSLDEHSFKVSGNSISIDNSVIDAWIFGGRSNVKLSHVNKDSITIKSLLSSQVKEVELDAVIESSDLSGVDFSNVTFSSGLVEFQDSNLKDADMHNSNIKESPNNDVLRSIEEFICFYGCEGVDTIKLPRGFSIIRFKTGKDVIIR